jgi:hypothetical protein
MIMRMMRLRHCLSKTKITAEVLSYELFNQYLRVMGIR